MNILRLNMYFFLFSQSMHMFGCWNDPFYNNMLTITWYFLEYQWCQHGSFQKWPWEQRHIKGGLLHVYGRTLVSAAITQLFIWITLSNKHETTSRSSVHIYLVGSGWTATKKTETKHSVLSGSCMKLNLGSRGCEYMFIETPMQFKDVY